LNSLSTQIPACFLALAALAGCGGGDKSEARQVLPATVVPVHYDITVRPDAMERAALKGYATATDLADYLVKKGLPFRDAHETVAHAVKLAPKYPDVLFAHCGGLWKKGSDPVNVGSYFGYIDECQYLNGIAAGYASKSKKIGFVAAKPIPQVLRNINAFTLGAQSVDPKITTHVIFTGDWSMPVKEAESTNSLADQGIDVITCHVDSPKVLVETAEKRGIKVCGYHANQAVLAPKGYLTGAEWNWETVYKQYALAAQQGGSFSNFTRGGLKEGFVKMSPYTAAVSADARKKADDIQAKMLAGSFNIFAGPLKDNTGKEVIAAGTSLTQTDVTLENMNYLVAGVVGTVTS